MIKEKRKYLKNLTPKDRKLLVDVGACLGNKRRLLKITQKEVAKDIGCCVATISQVEHGNFDSLRIYLRYIAFLNFRECENELRKCEYIGGA